MLFFTQEPADYDVHLKNVAVTHIIFFGLNWGFILYYIILYDNLKLIVSENNCFHIAMFAVLLHFRAFEGKSSKDKGEMDGDESQNRRKSNTDNINNQEYIQS